VKLSARVSAVLVAAYAALTALHIAYVVAHAPFTFDAWNVAMDTRGESFSVGRLLAFWSDQYVHANPRLGQLPSYLGYKLTGFAEVMTPVAFLALTYAVTALGLGRMPRRGRDLLMWMIAIGCAWFALPQIGRNLWSHAYSANYVYTAAVQLWFLVPLRLATTERAPLYGCFGVVAGMCNEHTGPMLLALALLAAWQRRDAERRFALAGAVGVAIGFALIFFAPGQGERYGELAQQVGLVTRLLQRGAGGLLDIVRSYIVYAAPLLFLAVLTAWRSPAKTWKWFGLAIGAGLLVTMTLFVSPKLGSRFFIVPMGLLLAAVIGLVDDSDERPWLALAVVASLYAVVRTVPTYREAGAKSEARLAMLAAARPGSVVVADAFGQVEESWWFIGDDFRDWRKRDAIARYLGLERVAFIRPDLDAPLGVAGVRLVPLVDGQEDPGFDLAIKDGFDLEGMRTSARDAVTRLTRTRAVTTFELRAAVPNIEAMGLPREQLVIARWEAGSLTSHVGKVTRSGRSTARTVKLPDGVPGLELYVAAVTGGSEPARQLAADLTYTPWRRGTYWILACDATECWVVAATRQGS